MTRPQFTFHTRLTGPPAQISALELASALASATPPLLVDVRSPHEQASGIIATALPTPPRTVDAQRAASPNTPARDIVIYCASGLRSQRAAQSLLQAGHSRVLSLTGGIAAWHAAGLPTAPPDALASPETARYARQTILPQLGSAGQTRLATSRVLIVGAGGLGSPVALYLAAAGVGTIGLIDDDRVELTNLQRQILHDESTIGMLKVDSAAAALQALNSSVCVITHPCRLEHDNAPTIFANYDLIVDGSDNLATRYLVNDTCVDQGLPFVYGALYHFDGQVAVFNHAGGPCYRCLYPDPPPAALAPSCAEAGVLGAVCGVIGSLQATAALRVLTGIGDHTRHELFSIDALHMQMRTLTLTRDPRCPSCGAPDRHDHAASQASEP